MLEQPIPHRMTCIDGYAIRYLDYDNAKYSSSSSSSSANHHNDNVLILLHGIGASAERWLSVSPALSKYFRLIVPDIIGFGYSDKPTVQYTMDFFIEFLQGFLENLSIDKASIIGSSFGGHLATEFAIRFAKRTEKLILAAPAGIMRSSTPVLDQYIMAALYPTYDNALKAFMDMAYDPSSVTEDTVRDFVNRMKLPNAKYAFMSTLLGMRESETLPGRLSKIISPTLLIWGDKDRMIPLQYAKEYNEIPRSNLVVIKDCGHTPYVEKPIAFNKAILKFLFNGI